MPVKMTGTISAIGGRGRRVSDMFGTQVMGETTVVGEDIARDLAMEAKMNLVKGTMNTPLSERGYGGEVKGREGYDHTATNRTFNSIKAEPVRAGRYSREWRVTAGFAAKVLEYGLQAGKNNVSEADILAWGDARGIFSTRTTEGRKAYARNIAEKIRRKGLAATRFWSSAEATVRGRLRGSYYTKLRAANAAAAKSHAKNLAVLSALAQRGGGSK